MVKEVIRLFKYLFNIPHSQIRTRQEFNLHSNQLGFEQTYNQIKKNIKAYNEIRPHASCDYLTPEQAHLKSEQLAKRWKNYNRRINI